MTRKEALEFAIDILSEEGDKLAVEDPECAPVYLESVEVLEQILKEVSKDGL